MRLRSAARPESESPSEVQAGQSGGRKLTRLPSLDGWRAVSIILVLGMHSTMTAGFPPDWNSVFVQVFDGPLGVRFFFIISGFLITWLMICESSRTGRVNLSHFYARRALRILPVYFAFLGTLGLLQLLGSFKQTAVGWIANATFTTDFFRGSEASSHLWSLSVEEQFYLIWPGILVGVGMLGNLRSLGGVLVIPLLLAPVFRVMAFKHFYPAALAPFFGPFSFLWHFDALAIGCGCAVLLAIRREVLLRFFCLRPWLWMTASLLVIFSLHLPLPVPGRLMAAFAPSLEAGALAVLLIQSVLTPGLGFYRALSWNWVRKIGILSYSLYIWQQMFCTMPELFGLPSVWWMSFPGWLVPVFIVATISYYGFERPLLRLRSRLR
jgi:peptidoglycan/LPS O-acetylase OafA/YrhL